MSVPAPAVVIARPARLLPEHYTQGVRFQLALFAVGFLIVCSRRPDAVLNAQFFAEDGAFFYRDAYHFGLHSLLLTYGGYFHTLLRLTAVLARLFPLAWAPLVMNLVGITVQVLPVNVFLSSRFSHVALAVRALGSFVYLALPNSFEIDANSTNLQWHQALLCCLLLLAVPAMSRAWRVFDGIALVITSLSSPIGILLIPTAALMWWHKIKTRYAVCFGLLIPGSIVQVVSILLHWHMRQAPHWDLTGRTVYNGGPAGANLYYFIRIAGRQVFLSSLLGLNTQHWLLQLQNLLALEFISTIIGIGFLLYALRYAPVELKLFVLFASSVLTMGLINPLAGPPFQAQWFWLCVPGIGNRYYFLPMLAFLACLVWAASWKSVPTVIRCVATILLLLLPIGIYRDWSYPRFRDFRFKQFAKDFKRVPAGTQFVIPVNPDWLMELTKR
jgi:hypothetical protein